MFRRRNSLILLFVAACICLNVFAFTLYQKNNQIRDASDWVQHTYEVIAQTEAVYSSLQDIMTNERGFLLSGQEMFLDTFQQSNQKIDVDREKLQHLVSDRPVQVARIVQLGEMIGEQRLILESQLARYRQGKSSAMPLTVEDISASKRVMDKIKAQIKIILDDERRLLIIRNAEEKKREDNYTATILFASLLSIGGLIAGCGFIFFLHAKRREIEENLNSSEQRFALAIKGMQDGIFDYKVLDGNIYFSPRLKAMLGETDETMPNTLEAFNSRMHPEDAEKTKETSRKYFAREIPVYNNVFRMRHRNGTWRWIMSRGAGKWDAHGRIVRLVGAHTDITEQREYEDNLKRINQELESFTYIASHDLRSPLVNLKGFASEMKMGLDELDPLLAEVEEKLDALHRATFSRVLREDIPDALNFIHSSVVKMDRLTNGILELSRIGRRELRSELVDIAQIVKHSIGALSHQIQGRGITVDVKELPPVVTDLLSIEQVFGNVIDNAIKYLDPGRPGHIEISGEVIGEMRLYRIRDNGRGIKDADAHKIFEIFRRAGNNDGILGEGMGMSYVKATLRRLGGSIWFESREGEGTTFYINVLNQIPNNARRAA